MKFPLAYRESNERCWVEDASGRRLLSSSYFAQTRLDGSPIPGDELTADDLARETLKELVRLANLRYGFVLNPPFVSQP